MEVVRRGMGYGGEGQGCVREMKRKNISEWEAFQTLDHIGQHCSNNKADKSVNVVGYKYSRQPTSSKQLFTVIFLSFGLFSIMSLSC